MLSSPAPPLAILDPLALALDAAATATARSAKKLARPRRRSGRALSPGPDTPLWNELASECRAYLVRYGDKARLARVLGLPRQRVHQLLVARSACPDAERTLQLLSGSPTNAAAATRSKPSPDLPRESVIHCMTLFPALSRVQPHLARHVRAFRPLQPLEFCLPCLSRSALS